MEQIVHAEREFALVIQQTKAMPDVGVAYLRLMLNYLYGLEVLAAEKPVQVASAATEHGASVRAIFLIQDEEITNRNALMSLGRKGQVPVILLMPPDLAARHQALSTGMPNVRVCDWTHSVGHDDDSLQSVVGRAFETYGVARLPVQADGLSADLLQARLTERLKHVDPLPTLPALVLRISRMLRDPSTNADDLEKVLTSDVAIVHRLLKVVNSSAYAGTRGEASWTLKEAIVRLGLKQVGAVAQQVKLINSFVRPEDSQFDLRRFWEHSVGCACIADRLYRDRLIPLKTAIDFDLYWVGSLLHDVGKLVLGFLAWDYFEEILQAAQSRQSSFRRAEERLGHEVTHEYLGGLMLHHSGAGEELLDVVGSHDTVAKQPSPLVCLVHIADNLAKDFGLGYLPEERANYSATVLIALGLSKDDLEHVKVSIEPSLVAEIAELVNYCLQD